MDTLKPYPEYRDSGLEWLGCIPQHWEVRRNGRLFMQRNSTGYGHLPILEVSLKTGVCVRNMDSLKRKQVISDRNKYKWAAKGDIAYNMMRMWQGAVGVAPVDGLVSPAYVVVRPRSDVEPRYFSYLFRTDIYKKEVDGFSRGIVKDRNRLYWEDFKRIPSCFPSLAEQKIIADYLDINAVKVRRFIRNRRRLIEVLNEKKQAIINQTVTRGLNSNLPLKPSGIDWVGDIPAHWEICRLRNVVSMVTSGSRGWSSYSADDGPLFIRIANLRRVSLDFRFDSVVRLNLPRTSELQRTQVRSNDLLISITAYIGSIAVVPPDFEEAYVSQHVARCPPRDMEHNPRWMGYVLLSEVGQTHGRLSLYGGTKDGLSLNDVKNYPMLLPPSDEQNRIVEYLERSLTEVDRAIRRTRREINLIREYRTRLISDVVTGKIDVQHLAPQAGSEDLEDMSEALEPLEHVIDDVEMDEEENVHESD